MTSGQIQSLMESLAEAQRAIEEAPGLRKEIAELKAELEMAYDDISNQKFDLQNRDSQIASLTEFLRAAEVARDEAMFREQDANERASLARQMVQSLVDLGKDYLAKIVPVSEVAAGVAVQQETSQQGNQSDASPTAADPVPLISPSSPAPIGDHTDAETPAAVDTSDKPYLGWAHWAKPHDVTWREFEAGGGKLSSWVTESAKDST